MTSPGNSPETPTSAPSPETPDLAPRTVAVQMRTAPKIWAFMVTGILLGAVVALVFTWFSHASLVDESPDGTTEHSFIATFGFMLVVFAFLGAAVGALAFLLVDRLGRRKPRTVELVVEPMEDPEPEPIIKTVGGLPVEVIDETKSDQPNATDQPHDSSAASSEPSEDVTEAPKGAAPHNDVKE